MGSGRVSDAPHKAGLASQRVPAANEGGCDPLAVQPLSRLKRLIQSAQFLFLKSAEGVNFLPWPDSGYKMDLASVSACHRTSGVLGSYGEDPPAERDVTLVAVS